MPPKKPNVKSTYKKTLKLELEKLKNGEIQGTKVDLTKIKINTLAKKIGVLSEDVKMYMYLFNSKRYYVLNDRTINLLMKGSIDMSASCLSMGWHRVRRGLHQYDYMCYDYKCMSDY